MERQKFISRNFDPDKWEYLQEGLNATVSKILEIAKIVVGFLFIPHKNELKKIVIVYSTFFQESYKD